MSVGNKNSIKGNKTKISTLLFADQVLFMDTDNNLQRGIFTLNNTTQDFGMEISISKLEEMSFLGINIC